MAAAREYYHQFDDSATSTTSLSFIDLPSATRLVWTPQSGSSKYFVIAQARVRSSNIGTAVQSQLVEDLTTATNSQYAEIEPQFTDANWRPHVELYEYTSPASPVQVTHSWQVSRRANNNTVQLADTNILAIKAAGNDQLLHIADTSTTSTSYTTLGSVSPSANGNYIIICTAKGSTGGGADRSCFMRWQAAGTALGADGEPEQNDTDNQYPMTWVGYRANMTTSDTIECFGKVDGGTVTYTDIDILLLDADEFLATQTDVDATTRTTTSTSSLTQAQSLTNTGSGEYIFMFASWGAAQITDSSAETTRTRTIYDGVTTQAEWYPAATQSNVGRIIPFADMKVVQNDGANADYVLNFYTTDATKTAEVTGPSWLITMQLTGSAGQTVTVGVASETDTGQTVTPVSSQTVTVSVASETDTGQTVTATAGAATVTVGVASETDSGQPVTATGAVTVTVGVASETDSGQTISAIGAQSVTVAVATETDTGQTVTVSAGAVSVTVGVASESDTGQTVGAAAGQVTTSVGVASETDTGQTIAAAASVTVTVAVGSETDTAQTVTVSAGAATVTVGVASETDTGQTITAAGGAASATVGVASETDAANSVAAVAPISVAVAAETDTAQTITAVPGAAAVTVGVASETDTANTIRIAVVIAVGLASETDAGNTVAVALGATLVPVGVAIETDAAVAVSIKASASGQVSTVPVVAAVNRFDLRYVTETPPTQGVVPSLRGMRQRSEISRKQFALWSHFGPTHTVSRNVFIRTDGVATYKQPFPDTLISRTLYGGVLPDDVTESEVASVRTLGLTVGVR